MRITPALYPKLKFVLLAGFSELKELLKDENGFFPLPANLGFPFLPTSGAVQYIQSIQTFSITIASGSTSNTATISSVNTSNAYIAFGGQITSATAINSATARVALTSATVVTATRNTSTATTTIVSGTVVEYTSSAVVSIQSGTITVTGTSNTATISSVTTANSAVFYLGQSSSSATTGGSSVFYTDLTLTNATTVTAKTNTSLGAPGNIIGFAVIQFQAAIINNIQQFSLTTATAATSITQTITSVVTANTMIAYGNSTSAVNGYTNAIYILSLTNSTTVTLTRTGTNTSSRTINFTVIEFVSGILNSLNRGTTALTSATSNTATIGAVNTAKSFVNFCGYNSLAAAEASVEASIVLTNSTTVTSAVNTASASTTTTSWEIVEFVN